MDYKKQMDTFYEFLPNNPISSNAQCLYSYLLNKNSKLGWIKEFTIANSIVCGITGLSRQALDKARNELKQKGYIKYSKGLGNKAGKYLIVYFDTQIDTQCMTQIDTQCMTQIDTQDMTQCAHINKKENISKKERKEEQLRRPSFNQLIDDYTKNEELRNVLKRHLITRKQRQALNNEAIAAGLKNLNILTQNVGTELKQDRMKIAIVEKSIENGWSGFFAIKEEKKQTLKPNKPNFECKNFCTDDIYEN